MGWGKCGLQPLLEINKQLGWASAKRGPRSGRVWRMRAQYAWHDRRTANRPFGSREVITQEEDETWKSPCLCRWRQGSCVGWAAERAAAAMAAATIDACGAGHQGETAKAAGWSQSTARAPCPPIPTPSTTGAARGMRLWLLRASSRRPAIVASPGAWREGRRGKSVTGKPPPTIPVLCLGPVRFGEWKSIEDLRRSAGRGSNAYCPRRSRGF
jgi:hypothetical protein